MEVRPVFSMKGPENGGDGGDAERVVVVVADAGVEFEFVVVAVAVIVAVAAVAAAVERPGPAVLCIVAMCNHQTAL